MSKSDLNAILIPCYAAHKVTGDNITASCHSQINIRYMTRHNTLAVYTPCESVTQVKNQICRLILNTFKHILRHCYRTMHIHSNCAAFRTVFRL